MFRTWSETVDTFLFANAAQSTCKHKHKWYENRSSLSVSKYCCGKIMCYIVRIQLAKKYPCYISCLFDIMLISIGRLVRDFWFKCLHYTRKQWSSMRNQTNISSKTFKSWNITENQLISFYNIKNEKNWWGAPKNNKIISW